MRVLLLGGGGREHAIGWKLSQSRRLTELVSAPGNPGLAGLGATVAIDITDPAAVVELATARHADLVVVGPEAPLAAGVADALAAAGIAVFGPTRAGAMLESSKAFAKEIMAEAGVPTASSATFTDAEEAVAHLATIDPPYVVKADGLAAGKGVLVTDDLFAAQGWARVCIGGKFGAAGEQVVVERFLDGREVSVFAICNGTDAVVLEPARDYKRLLDGGRGPNTGGMGCFSPPTDLPDDLLTWTRTAVIAPVLATLQERGIAYRGFLYVGLMLTEDGPMVLEFNCRLGDPETQVVLPRLESDLLDVLAGAAAGTLPDALEWSATTAVDVVLASRGYPESPERGHEISGLDDVAGRNDVLVFHAGTSDSDGAPVTAGGRVLNVVGLGSDLATARAAAYDAAGSIDFEGKQFRTDIAGGSDA